jgi:ABC-type lipoprotein export system ATPase subunit
MNGLAVACRRVVHIYRAEAGDVVALAGVDLSIGPGEMLALVGPSGSGKSTLVALLAGLMRASAGRVNVGTYDLGKLTEPELARLRGTLIGVVLQGAARNLLPYTTLHRNIWLAQRRAARTAGIELDHPDRILDLVGLPGQGRARVGDLAPGARQRAALAVGIAAGPGLLLVDEPTSQLDTAGRDEVLTALETVNAERGTTIVVVTHDVAVGAPRGGWARRAATGRTSRWWRVTARYSFRRRYWARSRRAPCSRSSGWTTSSPSWWVGSSGRAHRWRGRACKTRQLWIRVLLLRSSPVVPWISAPCGRASRRPRHGRAVPVPRVPEVRALAVPLPAVPVPAVPVPAPTRPRAGPTESPSST